MKIVIPDKQYMNALVNDEIVGGYYVLPYEKNPDDKELLVLWIDNDHQNKGLGTKIWHHIENSYETDLWWLQTPKFAKSNPHFCEKLRFEKVDEHSIGDLILYLYKKEL